MEHSNKPHVAYYRVSTAKQGRSGLGLEAQRHAVMSLGITPVREFTEVESGKRDDRPELKAALDYARLTGATLVVAKLDRLSRNAAFLNTIMDSGQQVLFADMPSADRLVLGIMAQLAQWEREQISKRTREALSAAKARGRKLGGDRGNLSSVSVAGRQRSIEARKAKAADRKALLMPYVNTAREQGIVSLAGIADYLNAQGFKTNRGGQWYAASVARLLA